MSTGNYHNFKYEKAQLRCRIAFNPRVAYPSSVMVLFLFIFYFFLLPEAHRADNNNFDVFSDNWIFQYWVADLTTTRSETPAYVTLLWWFDNNLYPVGPVSDLAPVGNRTYAVQIAPTGLQFCPMADTIALRSKSLELMAHPLVVSPFPEHHKTTSRRLDSHFQHWIISTFLDRPYECILSILE